MRRPDQSFTIWWTQREHSWDRRTGAFAVVATGHDRWRWSVSGEDGKLVAHGDVKSKRQARAKCRAAVQALPDRAPDQAVGT